MKITTYEQAFLHVLNMPFTSDAQERMKRIEREDYTERNIACAIWRGQDKILSFKGDARFWGVLENEVRKHAYKKSDWYNKADAQERVGLYK